MALLLDRSVGIEKYVLDAIKIIEDSITAEDKISVSFSGGKDSTAVLLLVGLLIKLGKIQPHQVSILHSDTTIEFPLLVKTTLKVLESVRALWGVKVDIVSSPIEERFFATLLGIGRPVPNHAIRWCTDNLKLKPQQKLRKAYQDSFVLTGEHYGESSRRDQKLSSCGSSDCGVVDVSKIVSKEKLIRPIINWTDCKVWDFIYYADSLGLLFNGLFDELSRVYEISNDDYKSGSLRTGCIGCPVISTIRHYSTEAKGVPSRLSLKLRLMLEELRDDSMRVLNPKIMGYKKNGYLGMGALAITVRRHYWEEFKILNTEFMLCNIVLISPEEETFIENCLTKGSYPKTYKPEQIVELEKEWLNRKPEWMSVSK